jgi:hypothetical protein
MWPAFNWGAPDDPRAAAREYGRALMDIGDAAAIEAGVSRALREVDGRFPPPLAELLRYVKAEKAPAMFVVPDAVPNRCSVCRELGEDPGVVVDANGWASCVNGEHRRAWKVA